MYIVKMVEKNINYNDPIKEGFALKQIAKFNTEEEVKGFITDNKEHLEKDALDGVKLKYLIMIIDTKTNKKYSINEFIEEKI